jgi:hypothetical protein
MRRRLRTVHIVVSTGWLKVIEAMFGIDVGKS